MQRKWINGTSQADTKLSLWYNKKAPFIFPLFACLSDLCCMNDKSETKEKTQNGSDDEAKWKVLQNYTVSSRQWRESTYQTNWTYLINSLCAFVCSMSVYRRACYHFIKKTAIWKVINAIIENSIAIIDSFEVLSVLAFLLICYSLCPFFHSSFGKSPS